MAKSIMVVPEGKKGWKILVDFLQWGGVLHSPVLANQEASKIHRDEYPKAALHLAVIEPKKPARGKQ